MGCLFFAQEFLSHNVVKQLSAIAYFCDEVDVLGILEILVELEDIGVVQRLQDLDLIIESLPVLDLLPRYGFTCSDLPGSLVEHPMNHSI